MKEPIFHRGQTFTINNKHVEILNFISDNKGETVQVEIMADGKYHKIDYEYFLNAEKTDPFKKGKKELIITECKNGYQVKTSSGKMFALEPNGKNYDITSLPIQPMTGILVHGIPDKIKSIVFNLQKK